MHATLIELAGLAVLHISILLGPATVQHIELCSIYKEYLPLSLLTTTPSYPRLLIELSPPTRSAICGFLACSSHPQANLLQIFMATTHLLVLPFPAQGHVIALMELSHQLVEHGFEITFINTEFNHERVLKSLAKRKQVPEGIHMVAVPDGLAPDDDRNDISNLVEGCSVMLRHLQEFITRTNQSGAKTIKWLIADLSMSRSVELAKKMGIPVALFSTFSAASFVLRMNLQRLMEDGILDQSGFVKRKETIQLSPKMPPIDATEIPWSHVTIPERQKAIFDNVLRTNKAIALADIIVCNSFHEIESGAFALFPDILPIGPLLADQRSQKPTGHFWPEDIDCLNWLDEQPANSVIYVAFGSFTILNVTQFQELATGLALLNRPFLWVVRPDFTKGLNKDWLDEFKCRVEGRGMIVNWSPQQQVLAHPSIACFLSHCGWNSTMEGMWHGIPFLCWPYFADQFFNQSYICNVWNVGLKLCPDEKGIVTKEEIGSKVMELLGNEEIKARALMLKDAASRSVGQGGTSYDNFKKFVDLLRQ